MKSALDRLIPTPRLLEVDHVDLALDLASAWKVVRHGNLGRTPLIRALFALRTLADQIFIEDLDPLELRIDHLSSTPEHPGFRILVDNAEHEIVVGAIGKVWRLEIPFVHVTSADAFALFDERDFVKVAWALRVTPLGEHDTRVTFELRVDATDERAWRKFRWYFRFIGPFSHFIRRSLLAQLAREHGTPESKENERPLPGDDLLPDATEQATNAIVIAAKPEAIWPWLAQMGCGRAGFYSFDTIDNGGERSARDVHPELQDIRVGQILRASPDSPDGFEVLRVEKDRVLVLGGLYDMIGKRQLPFAAKRPDGFWQTTWTFVLEPIDATTTRLHVRGRAAYRGLESTIRAAWMPAAHGIMQSKQLANLARRIENRTRDDWRDVASGLGGMAVISALLLLPFLREERSHWGLSEELANRAYAGDHLVPEPRWMWTHAVEIDAPASEVWPWVVQIGADRAGFYSYQWLENLAGCKLRNAEVIKPEWALKEGSGLVLHPKMPPLEVVFLVPGECFVAYAAPDDDAIRAGRPWASASWLFVVEPIDERRSRVISRYRCACSNELATKLLYGPTILEPIGFAMDRRMLLGIKARAEKRELQRHAAARPRKAVRHGSRLAT